MQQTPALPTEGFARLPQVLAFYGIKKTAFYNGIAAGRFPKPVKLGQRISVWRVEEIRAVGAKK